LTVFWPEKLATPSFCPVLIRASRDDVVHRKSAESLLQPLQAHLLGAALPAGLLYECPEGALVHGRIMARATDSAQRAGAPPRQPAGPGVDLSPLVLDVMLTAPAPSQSSAPRGSCQGRSTGRLGDLPAPGEAHRVR
jgi:hypothetical protein